MGRCALDSLEVYGYDCVMPKGPSTYYTTKNAIFTPTPYNVI